MPLLRLRNHRYREVLPGGRARRCVAWLAAVALVLQSLLPILSQPYMKMSGDAVLGGLLVLCTPEGFKVVKVPDPDDTGTTPGPRNPHPKPQFCPICLTAQIAGTGLATPYLMLAPPALAVGAPDGVPARLAAVGRAYSPHSPRAPPILS